MFAYSFKITHYIVFAFVNTQSAHMIIFNQIIICFVLGFIAEYEAKIYIVDGENGSDLNRGNDIYSPFKTIKHCVDVLINPGDECHIRSGRYVNRDCSEKNETDSKL